VLLVIPLVVMLVMIAVGVAIGGGMMSGTSNMMSDGISTMSPWLMALCVLWALLVAASLIFLIVLLARGVTRA
jgi:hypothetical protein